MLSSSSAWTSNTSPIEMLVTRACNPALPEPNYALHLEVAEYINQKKANTPRESAMLIARLVNHRNPHVAMLALALLETLVQSCGYPFHLQIGTKEFLNELVRRFPERPPPFPGPVMTRILDLINDWKEGIASESRWKEDLGNIRDMHRLLTFKGYRFRDRPRQPPIASASTLKTADELEAEDREAQEAKLQELIRRGTPRDLAAAQELMKTLAGANPDAKPDYRTQALTELNKLESKVILLNEVLDNVDTTRGEKFVQGDVYDQVASILTAARPKIQGWISNAESDDPESLNTFLQINDQINTVLQRYESYKKGDYAAASNPVPPELGGGRQDLSLIDFDDAESSNPPANANSNALSSAAPIDELASLFGPSLAAPASNTSPQPAMGLAGAGFGANMGMMGTNSSMGMGMGTGMGMSPNMGMVAPTPMNGYNVNTNLGMGGSSAFGQRPGTTSPSQNAPMGSIRLGTPSGSASGSDASSPMTMPNYFSAGTPSAMGSSMSMGTGTGMGMGGQMQPMQPQHIQRQFQQPQHAQQFQQPQPQGLAQQQQQHPPQAANAASAQTQQAQGKDPFADLVGLF